MAGTGGMYDGGGINDGTQTWDLYKARDVNVTVNDDLMWGYQTGDMVTVDKTNDDIEAMSDAQGSAGASVNYDALGTATLNLRSLSPCSNTLLDHYNAKEMFSFWVDDGHYRVGGDHCMIQKAPTTTRGTGVPTMAWQIIITDYSLNSK